VTIHEIASDKGMDFIVMEHVPGKTLDELVPRKGMRLKEALSVATQIADALAAAHAAGIIHRDLKPGNVMVTERGQAKVLDFGLVKLTDGTESPESDDRQTLSSGTCPKTEEGTIWGTASYMSPEQAEGKKVDVRSDIFSFGSVLYEMVTARRAFQGDSRMSTMAAILREDPKPASQIAKDLPIALERIITRCLQKDPKRRFQHMDDVQVELEELRQEADSGAMALAPPQQLGHRRWRRIAAGLALLCVAGISAWFFYSRPHARLTPLSVIPLTSYPGGETSPSFSPDGNQVAFSWNGDRQDNADIYIKLIGPATPLRLTTDPRYDALPSWSPDGRWIAFLRLTDDNKASLLLIAPTGGPERLLAENLDLMESAPVRRETLSWSPDGKWIAVPIKGSPMEPAAIFTIAVETGEIRRLTAAPAETIGDGTPAFSPDGRTLAFTRFLSDQVAHLYLLPLSPGPSLDFHSTGSANAPDRTAQQH